MISVIIPCFNAAETIICALDSLKKQTYKDFEVIIVNDGSSDCSEIVITEYINANPELAIRYYCQANQGVSSARNKGMLESKGEYIAFLDADDTYTVHFLQFLYEALDNGNHDIAFCRYEYVKKHSEDLSIGEHYEQLVLNKYELLNTYIHKRKTKLNFCGALYKSSIIHTHSIMFPENLKYGEDSVFLCKYMYHCASGVYLRIPMYRYFVSATSAMHKDSYEKVQTIDSYKTIVAYWEKDENFEQEVGEYMIDRAIWAVAKDFCNGNKKYYRALLAKYDVRRAMNNMIREGDELLIRLSARVFIIHPMLFRLVIRLAMGLGNL